MKYTENLKLLKPDAEDFYNIDDFNKNAEILERAIANISKEIEEIPTDIGSLLGAKVDKQSGKGLSANDYTNVEKEKLANAVPKTRKINGKALSSDITLLPADIGTIISTTSPPIQEGKIWLKPVD